MKSIERSHVRKECPTCFYKPPSNSELKTQVVSWRLSMIGLRLRHATHADCSDIRQIIRNSHLNPTGVRYHRFVVAVTSAGKVVGCGEVKPRSTGIFELASIAVLDIYRKRGVARHIIEHLLENEPKRPIYVICRLEMRVFYEKFGFRVLALGEMPLYYRVLILVNRLLFIFSRRRHILIMVCE